MNGFVAVHCGAGYHSDSLKKEYQKTCNNACRKAMEALRQGCSAVEAVEKAVIELENSPLTNAGYGSNLTWHGGVECDASVMDGQTLHFGACGAVSGVWNPVSLAKQLCVKQCDNLSLGRVPPCILTGKGAVSWAQRMGVETVDARRMVSARALRTYKHCRRKLKRFSRQNDLTFGPLDTVGALCVDHNGVVAAGASSGGVSLKHEGRVGQAAVFGSGVWAVMSRDGTQPSVASCTSGCGEHLIRTQLARRAAESLSDDTPTLGLSRCLKQDFLESPFLWDVGQRLGGALALRLDPQTGEGEVLWGHSTATMCVGYMTTTDHRPKIPCLVQLRGTEWATRHGVERGTGQRLCSQASEAASKSGPVRDVLVHNLAAASGCGGGPLGRGVGTAFPRATTFLTRHVGGQASAQRGASVVLNYPNSRENLSSTIVLIIRN